jgi:hypothetical protein
MKQPSDMLCNTSSQLLSPQLVRDNICNYLGIADGSQEELPVDRASLPVQVRGPPLPLHLLPHTHSR